MSTKTDYVQILRTNKVLNARRIQDAPRSSQRGFSLLEVLIATSLTAFGILAVGQLLFTSAATFNLARSREAAALAAQNKLEYLSGLYHHNSAHPDLAFGEHGPEDVSFRDPNDGRILDRIRISWSAGGLQDPRPGPITAAVSVIVAATPIRNDGVEMDHPYYGRTVAIAAVLGPQIK